MNHQGLPSDFLKLGAFATDAKSGDIILGFGGNIETSNHLPQGSCFFLKDFFQNSYLIYRPENFLRLSKEKLLSFVENLSEKLEITEKKNFDDIYLKDFQELKKSFNSELKKVVLISREEFKLLRETDVRLNFLNKSLTFGAGLPYGFWSHDFGIIGNSPELLYSIQGEMIYTHALAGSSIQGEEEKLLHSSKDRLEHQLVIDDILEKLSPQCHELTPGETRVTPFRHMIHLRTDICGKLKSGWTHEKLTETLSPTAALGGYSPETAKKFLQNTHYYKLHPKRYFGSTFGLSYDNCHQGLVAIRNIQWQESAFWIESGGGVLSLSEAEKELQEIRLKRNIIKEHYLCDSP
jgi:isochorismate synthase EntC